MIERNPDKITKNVSLVSEPAEGSLHVSSSGSSSASCLVQVEREIINHSCLIHPHIVRFRECFLTPKYLGIAMEYAAGGDLYRYVAAK